MQSYSDVFIYRSGEQQNQFSKIGKTVYWYVYITYMYYIGMNEKTQFADSLFIFFKLDMYV